MFVSFLRVDFFHSSRCITRTKNDSSSILEGSTAVAQSFLFGLSEYQGNGFRFVCGVNVLHFVN